MNAQQLKQKYLDFFKEKKHTIIPSASLIPANDPSVLFNTAGMQPLVPYLTGQKHPAGKRLVNYQKCLRTVDFENIGDNTHHTFFEMLGNWSLGDYFKKEAITWSFEFLTGKKWLNVPLKKLAFTVYQGDDTVPKDEESYTLWRGLGVPEERIAFLGEDNFWKAGDTGPCGPSTEMFYWTGDEDAPEKFNPDDNRWVEIWNDVFMSYNRIQRTILVDGMHTMYNDNFKLNTELLKVVNSFKARKILVVNGFREKGKKLLENEPFEAFSLEEKKITKENPQFFITLLKKLSLDKNDVIYVDHKPENVTTARKVGIRSERFENPKQVKEFLQKELFYFKPLAQKNVDTGMGMERTLAVLNGKKSAYETDLFQAMIKELEMLSGEKYGEHTREMRIIVDHLRAAVFVLGDDNGIAPSNVDRGYILRRLIRRAVRFGKLLELEESFLPILAKIVVKEYKNFYPELERNKERIYTELQKEEEKFERTLEKGLREFAKMAEKGDVTGKDAFLLFQSYGFPLEMTEELSEEKGITVNTEEFFAEFERHQALSKKGAEQKFKGGLGDLSPETVKLHTATHLLNEALRKIISPDIHQRGSNITLERLRFDFNFARKLTEEEVKKVEAEVNRVINLDLPVIRKEMSREEAEKIGAEKEFGQKYPEKVSVYFVGDYSKEFCGGPHVARTGEIGHFKIIKEESSAAGVRRIKAVVREEPSEVA